MKSEIVGIRKLSHYLKLQVEEMLHESEIVGIRKLFPHFNFQVKEMLLGI